MSFDKFRFLSFTGIPFTATDYILNSWPFGSFLCSFVSCAVYDFSTPFAKTYFMSNFMFTIYFSHLFHAASAIPWKMWINKTTSSSLSPFVAATSLSKYKNNQNQHLAFQFKFIYHFRCVIIFHSYFSQWDDEYIPRVA